MVLSLSQMLVLAAQCAPEVAPLTLLSIAQVESRFDPHAIGVNGPKPLSLRPASASEAAALAATLIAEGQSIDLGLGQINSRNLPWLGLTPRSVFDPCLNLTAAARVLTQGLDRSVGDAAGPALSTALSYYNTGSPRRGLTNGYVARITRAAAELRPALEAHAARPAPDPAELSPWDVFGRQPVQPGFFLRFSPVPANAEPNGADQ